MKPVFVSWLDAVSEDAWTSIDEAKEEEPPVIMSLGYLIYEDDKKLVIAANLDETNGNCSAILSIPRTWLLEMKELRI